jgi:hypothetical protein
VFGVQATGSASVVRPPAPGRGDGARIAPAAAENGACRSRNAAPAVAASCTGRRAAGDLWRVGRGGARAAGQVAPKPAQWTLIGKPTPRLDTPMKVDGSAVFGVDVKLDGLLVGTVMACPVFGGRLRTVDQAPALAVKGVRAVVPLDDAVVVVADGYWPALKGLRALAPEWDEGASAAMSSASIRAEFMAALRSPPQSPRPPATTALAGAATQVEAVYECRSSRDDGADERHRPSPPMASKSRRRPAQGPISCRRRVLDARRDRSRSHDLPRRRLRAPFRNRLRVAGGAGGEGGRRAGQADLVARGRHPP